MAHSLSQIILHIIFTTKYRADLILKYLLHKTHAYIATICRNHDSQAFRVGGTQNHVHIACSLPRTLTVSKLLEEIKKSSSKWIKEIDVQSKEFAWQNGYGAFSVGFSQLHPLIRYIKNQEEHHRRQDFGDEMREILGRYGIEDDAGKL